MSRVKINHKLTKDEARKILAECRANKDWNIDECLDGLNDGRYSEILLTSYAKIVGRDRHYCLNTYAEDANDGLFPMTVIGRACPLGNPFGQENRHLVSYDKNSSAGETWIFRFDNGYYARVEWNIYNKSAEIRLMAIDGRTRKPRVIKDHGWNRGWEPFSWEQIRQGLEAIKAFPKLELGTRHAW